METKGTRLLFRYWLKTRMQPATTYTEYAKMGREVRLSVYKTYREWLDGLGFMAKYVLIATLLNEGR